MKGFGLKVDICLKKKVDIIWLLEGGRFTESVSVIFFVFLFGKGTVGKINLRTSGLNLLIII